MLVADAQIGEARRVSVGIIRNVQVASIAKERSIVVVTVNGILGSCTLYQNRTIALIRQTEYECIAVKQSTYKKQIINSDPWRETAFI